MLAEKAAGPDLTDDAREQLGNALNQYLTMGVQGNPLHLHGSTQQQLCVHVCKVMCSLPRGLLISDIILGHDSLKF